MPGQELKGISSANPYDVFHEQSYEDRGVTRKDVLKHIGSAEKKLRGKLQENPGLLEGAASPEHTFEDKFTRGASAQFNKEVNSAVKPPQSSEGATAMFNDEVSSGGAAKPAPHAPHFAMFSSDQKAANLIHAGVQTPPPNDGAGRMFHDFVGDNTAAKKMAEAERKRMAKKKYHEHMRALGLAR